MKPGLIKMIRKIYVIYLLNCSLCSQDAYGNCRPLYSKKPNMFFSFSTIPYIPDLNFFECLQRMFIKKIRILFLCAVDI